MKLYKRRIEVLKASPFTTIPYFPSPDTKTLAPTNIALLKFGAGALSEDLVSTYTLRTRSHRYPCDGELCGTLADLPSIGRADGLTSCGTCTGRWRGGCC